jgi:hypothetical protein
MRAEQTKGANAMANPQQNAEDTAAANKIRAAFAKRTAPVTTGTQSEAEARTQKDTEAERVEQDNRRLIAERARYGGRGK